MALTSEQRVTKSHIAIMRSKQFCMFAGVLSVGNVEFTEDIPTACTNGRDVIYSPSFIKTLNDKELNFVVLHEALHKVYQHMHLWKKLFKESPQLTNMAADYVVNYAIHEADQQSDIAQRPDSALFDMQYANMTTKQVFDLLKQTGGNGESGHDTHDWEGAENLSDEEVKQTIKELDQALRQGEIIRSKMQGNKNRAVNEILEPKVDWREQLREFVSLVHTANYICNIEKIGISGDPAPAFLRRQEWPDPIPVPRARRGRHALRRVDHAKARRLSLPQHPLDALARRRCNVGES